jgi:hypothetical protein
MRSAIQAGALALLVSPFLSVGVYAGPATYIATPIVEEGEREIDFKLGTARLKDGSRESQQTLGIGWGVNKYWFTELYALWHKPVGEAHSFDAWEWENKFQLTETGRYPVDVGFLLEIERPAERSEGYEIVWGPLLQTEIGNKVQLNANLLFERHIKSEEPSETELAYQWQAKYRWRPDLEWGAQGLGGFGPWQNWNASKDQSHAAGPALFGKINLGERKAIKYNAAWLLGLTDATPHNTFRMQVEFEF